mmetsp:Transcript_55482/g.117983  ORF Transcript_55482/g.117983 Transcript_55482/m.117983 type:complete len:219 (+) Transcript_55482:654-1310(+)
MVLNLFHSIIHGCNVPTHQLFNTPIHFFLDDEAIANASIRILVLLEHFNHLDASWPDHPVDRQRIARLIARADERLPHHGVAGLLQLPVELVVRPVAKGRVGASASGDLSAATRRGGAVPAAFPATAPRVATDLGPANGQPERLEARLTLLVLLLVDLQRRHPVEAVVQRGEARGPLPLAGFLSEIFLLQGEVDAHVIHFHLGDERRDDGAHAHNVLG